MKSVLGIVCIWLLAGQGFAFQPLAFQPSQTYVYEGESRFTAVIPSLDDSSLAAFSMKYLAKFHIVSEHKFVMTITNVRTARVNGDVPEPYDADELNLHHTASVEYERALSTPVAVTTSNGVIVEFEAEESDPVWAVNIKKAILSLYQVDLTKEGRPVPIPGENQERHIHPDAELYVVLEDGLWGEVPTKYHVQSIESLDDPNAPGDVLNVTKIKNYRQATNAPLYGYHNYDGQGCPEVCHKDQPKQQLKSYIPGVPPTWNFGDSDYCSGCPYGFEPDHQPVKAYSIVKYNISGASHKPIIDEIENENKIVYELNGNEIVLYTWQSLNLTHVRSTKNAVKVVKPQKYQSLAYELPDMKDSLELRFMAIYGPVNEDEVQGIVLTLLKSVADDLISDDPSSSEKMGAKVIEVTNAINMLTEEDLNEITQSLNGKAPNRRQQAERSLWLQCLGLAVTNEAAKHSIALIEERRVTTFEATQLLEGIAKNLQKPQNEVIDRLLALMSPPKPMPGHGQLLNALAITIGKLVDQACVDPELTNSWEHSDDDSQPQPQPFSETEPSYPAQNQQPPRQPKRFARDATRVSKEVSSSTPVQYPCSPKSLRRYIETIGDLLKIARTANRMAIYIESLAHMTTPLVLPHLLPYINGEAPNMEKLSDDDTSFVSVVATYALHHIAYDHPEAVLPIGVSIYFDSSKDYQLRIAAFDVIMTCNPSLTLLHRIVTELNDEISNQVGYYAYSKLSVFSNSTLPCERALAQRIQSVINNAPEKYADAGIQSSQWWGDSFYDDENDYGVNWKAAMVSNNESRIPRAGYLSVEHILGPFQDQVLEAGFTAKGIDTIIDKLSQPGGILSQILSQTGSTVDTKNIQGLLDLVKAKLKLQESDEEDPRATIFWKFLGRTTYLTLDERSLMNTLETVVNWLRSLDPATGYSGQLTKIWMPSSLFYVLPTGMGLPAVVNHRNPIILNIYVESIHVAAGDHKESILRTPFAVSTVIHPTVHVSSLVFAYAVSPPEDLLYGAAFHRVYEVSTPIVIGIAADLEKDTYALSIKPKLPARVLFHKSIPLTFITAADVFSPPKADLIDDVNEINTIPELLKYDQLAEAQNWGLSYRVQSLSEDVWADIPTASSNGILASVVELLKNPEMKRREFHAYVEPHSQEPASQFIFTVDYNRTISPRVELSSAQPIPVVKQEECEDEEELFINYQDVVGHIYGQQYEESDAENTIQELIEKTKPTWSPALGQDSEVVRMRTISHVWAATAIIKGSGDSSKHFAGKLDYTHTLDHQGIFVQVHGHKTSSYGQPEKVYASLVAAYPPLPSPFYLEMNSGRSEQAKILARATWGQRGYDNEVIVRGVFEKTEEQLSSASVYLDTPQGVQHLPWFYHQSQLDRQNGETVSYANEQAIQDAAKFNKVVLEITAKNVSPAMLNVTNKIDLALKTAWYPNMESNPLVRNPSDTVTIEIESIDQIEGLPLTNVYISKPNENVHFTKLYTPYYVPPSALVSFEESYMDLLYAGESYPTCAVMEDYVSTFDNVTFKLPDNKCQYLLAQDTEGVPDYTILVSQIDLRANTKALSVAAAGLTVKLQPPTNGQQYKVTVNDKDIKVEVGRPIVTNFGKENEVIIFVRETVSPHAANVLTYYVPELQLMIQYDGKNVKVWLPRDHKGDNAGLCGDFNEEQYMEFSGPDGSVYIDAEDFAYSYAIPGQSCPNPPKPTGPFFPPSENSGHLNATDDQDNEVPSPDKLSPFRKPQGVSPPSRPPTPVNPDEEEEDEIPASPRQRTHQVQRQQRQKDWRRPVVEEEEEEEEDQPQPPRSVHRQPSKAGRRPQPVEEEEDEEEVESPRYQPHNPHPSQSRQMKKKIIAPPERRRIINHPRLSPEDEEDEDEEVSMPMSNRRPVPNTRTRY